jgi:glutamyl-tRNA reductase
VLPTLAALRTRSNEIADRLVQENAGKWESASERDLERVDALAHSIVNRLLHEPTLKMREMRDDRVHARMALIRELFGLEAETEAPATPESPPEATVEHLARRRSRARAAGSRLN